MVKRAMAVQSYLSSQNQGDHPRRGEDGDQKGGAGAVTTVEQCGKDHDSRPTRQER